MRAGIDLDIGQVQGRVHGSLGWRHAFGNVSPKQTLAFNGGRPFTVSGTPIAGDTAVLELGVDLNVSAGATLGVSYDAQLGSGMKEQAASISMRWRF